MDKGYAAAIIFILFLLVLVVTIMQFAAQKSGSTTMTYSIL